MEIIWALIINYPNYLNLLNLRNHSISQSINKCLGEGIKESIFEEQSYAGGISSEVLEQQNIESFGCRGVIVSGVGLHTYLIHWLLIKGILLPTLCWVSFMY